MRRRNIIFSLLFTLILAFTYSCGKDYATSKTEKSTARLQISADGRAVGRGFYFDGAFPNKEDLSKADKMSKFTDEYYLPESFVKRNNTYTSQSIKTLVEYYAMHKIPDSEILWANYIERIDIPEGIFNEEFYHAAPEIYCVRYMLDGQEHEANIQILAMRNASKNRYWVAAIFFEDEIVYDVLEILAILSEDERIEPFIRSLEVLSAPKGANIISERELFPNLDDSDIEIVSFLNATDVLAINKAAKTVVICNAFDKQTYVEMPIGDFAELCSVDDHRIRFPFEANGWKIRLERSFWESFDEEYGWQLPKNRRFYPYAQYRDVGYYFDNTRVSLDMGKNGHVLGKYNKIDLMRATSYSTILEAAKSAEGILDEPLLLFAKIDDSRFVYTTASTSRKKIVCIYDLDLKDTVFSSADYLDFNCYPIDYQDGRLLISDYYEKKQCYLVDTEDYTVKSFEFEEKLSSMKKEIVSPDGGYLIDAEQDELFDCIRIYNTLTGGLVMQYVLFRNNGELISYGMAGQSPYIEFYEYATAETKICIFPPIPEGAGNDYRQKEASPLPKMIQIDIPNEPISDDSAQEEGQNDDEEGKSSYEEAEDDIPFELVKNLGKTVLAYKPKKLEPVSFERIGEYAPNQNHLTCDFEEPGMYWLNEDTEYRIDLNNDGKKETLTIMYLHYDSISTFMGEELPPEDYFYRLCIKINDVVYGIDGHVESYKNGYLLVRDDGRKGLIIRGDVDVTSYFSTHIFTFEKNVPVMTYEDPDLYISNITMNSFDLSGPLQDFGTHAAFANNCILNDDFTVSLPNGAFIPFGYYESDIGYLQHSFTLTSNTDIPVVILENGKYVDQILPAGVDLNITHIKRYEALAFTLNDGTKGKIIFDYSNHEYYIDGVSKHDLFWYIGYAGG